MRLNENYAFNVLALFFFFNSKEGTEIPAVELWNYRLHDKRFFAWLQQLFLLTCRLSVYDTISHISLLSLYVMADVTNY